MARKSRWRIWHQYTRAQVIVYRLTRGRLWGDYRGAPVLLLHHRGRKSGKERVSPLIYIEDGEDLVVIGSKGGSHRHPAWFLNLREMAETEVEVGGERRRVKVRVATPEEKQRLWPRAVEIYPPYESYQRRTEREIPLVILSRVGA
jgi:F420H(2)-dependent quinone reductase